MNQERYHALEETLVRSAKQFGTLWGKKLEGRVSRHQLKILSILRTDGPQKVTDLAEALYLTPGAITGLTTKLEESGYIRRTRSEGDRRTVTIEITPQGEEMEAFWKRQKESLFREVLSGIREEELEQLAGFFARISDNMERMERRLNE
ncbi:MarR family winged helix-turn-helix transcriptional regulator [Gorillibacterium sp. sgz500922]|uniref:MarR family winged helix-turn-helix transcriptional regulator n=1 Tax=Gorillibacterium sp. sgz500922 TaxID=3446694 RepID=UPI003F668AC1